MKGRVKGRLKASASMVGKSLSVDQSISLSELSTVQTLHSSSPGLHST